jgi:short-subunit dehydrogenase
MSWALDEERDGVRYQNYLRTHQIANVISTVGLGIGNPLPFLALGEMKDMVSANLLSPFLILKHSFLPIKELGGGRVIMFGSIASVKADEGAVGYSATKMALRGLLESSRRELKSGYQSVSLHGVYTGNIKKVGLASVVDAVRYLLRLPYGVHGDIILN